MCIFDGLVDGRLRMPPVTFDVEIESSLSESESDSSNPEATKTELNVPSLAKPIALEKKRESPIILVESYATTS